ncbi:MAG: hypothetical protein ABH886_04205 [Candidatus Desantisbacteria bacterium]
MRNSMMKENERHILSLLPTLLRKDDEFRRNVSVILSEVFATKGELRQILEEIHKSREEANKRFEAMDKRFDVMDKRFEDQKDWVGTVIGGLQGRADRNLEDTIAGTLRVALNRKDIKPESIKLRQRIQDDEGVIGPKGRDYEFDILMNNGETAIFEIKSYAEPDDVIRFNDKVELAKQKLGLTNLSKIFITLQKHKEMVNTCKETGVELV